MNRSVGHSFTPVFPRPASLRSELSTFGFVVYRAGRGTASRLIVRTPQKFGAFCRTNYAASNTEVQRADLYERGFA
jgi:hypothetical protein